MTNASNALRSALSRAYQVGHAHGRISDKACAKPEDHEAYFDFDKEISRLRASFASGDHGGGFELLIEQQEKIGELEEKCARLRQNNESYYNHGRLEGRAEFEYEIQRLEGELAATKMKLRLAKSPFGEHPVSHPWRS